MQRTESLELKKRGRKPKNPIVLDNETSLVSNISSSSSSSNSNSKESDGNKIVNGNKEVSVKKRNKILPNQANDGINQSTNSPSQDIPNLPNILHLKITKNTNQSSDDIDKHHKNTNTNSENNEDILAYQVNNITTNYTPIDQYYDKGNEIQYNQNTPYPFDLNGRILSFANLPEINQYFQEHSELPTVCNYVCRYDTCPFHNSPYFLPIQKYKSKYIVKDVFCSINCLIAHLNHHVNHSLYNIATIMTYISELYDLVISPIYFKPAPVLEALDKFGGPLNISDFRSFGDCKNIHISITNLPLLPIQSFTEIIPFNNDYYTQNKKQLSNTGQFLKLQRNDYENQSTKRSVLDNFILKQDK